MSGFLLTYFCVWWYCVDMYHDNAVSEEMCSLSWVNIVFWAQHSDFRVKLHFGGCLMHSSSSVYL